MEQGAALFGKATFAMDRGYDDHKMFLKLDELAQDYVIRLKSNRKLLYHNKWTMATELRNRRKGKVKTNVIYRGKEHEAYLSHVKVQITASRKDIYLVLVYGITEHPMMLATNKESRSCKGKNTFLLLSVSKRYPWHTPRSATDKKAPATTSPLK